MRGVLIALALTLGACDSGDSSKDKTASAQKSKSKSRAESKSENKSETPVPAKAKLLADAIPAGVVPGDTEDEFTGFDPRVARAARIARDIAGDPKGADGVLLQHGLDRPKLDALMYEIAGDENLTEQYRIARGL